MIAAVVYNLPLRHDEQPETLEMLRMVLKPATRRDSRGSKRLPSAASQLSQLACTVLPRLRTVTLALSLAQPALCYPKSLWGVE